MSSAATSVDLATYIRDIRDFPRPGILFRDITPLLGNAKAFSAAVDRLCADASQHTPDAIIGIESRGFLFGGPLADRLGLRFVPVRKPGKLPAPHMSVEYSLEYGENQLDIHDDALEPGQRAYIVDDLLATGGTARATAKLVELIGGVVAGLGFVIELEALQGRSQLGDYPVHSLLRY
jgi:adenine phosphoribosyltransferase